MRLILQNKYFFAVCRPGHILVVVWTYIYEIGSTSISSPECDACNKLQQTKQGNNMHGLSHACKVGGFEVPYAFHAKQEVLVLWQRL